MGVAGGSRGATVASNAAEVHKITLKYIQNLLGVVAGKGAARVKG